MSDTARLDLPARDQRKPFSDGCRATLPHLQCGVTVSSSWHDPVACAFERGHEGEHSWASLPAISPLPESERLREAAESAGWLIGEARSIIAELADEVRGNYVIDKDEPPQLAKAREVIAEADDWLAAVPEERE